LADTSVLFSSLAQFLEGSINGAQIAAGATKNTKLGQVMGMISTAAVKINETLDKKNGN
jgi:hypothetical protein